MIVPLLLAALAFAFPAAADLLPVWDDEPAWHEVGPEPELVVLVHGMGRTPISMLPLARALEDEGYEVVNWGYSSLCCTVAELAERLRREVEERQGPEPRRIHFVGHSLGNIIVRWMLTQEDAPDGVGRVVMLAPPNQGSHEADRHAPAVGWLLRPINEIRTDRASTVRRIPKVENVPIGIIAGRDDGKVAVHETRLPEARDHVVVPSAHTFIMLRDDVRRLVIGFLRDAAFPELPGVEPAAAEQAAIPARSRGVAKPAFVAGQERF